MHSGNGENQTIVVTDLSNREFLERYAQPGRVGLSSGLTLADRVICRAQCLDGEKGSWSHVFMFQGLRADGHHWLLESDLQFHKKNIQLGVQENRIAKYFDEDLYSSLAVIDFGVTEDQIGTLVREGLEMVASRTRYSIRELVGTYIALKRPELRGKENVLARDSSVFCSALVQHLYRKAGLDLLPGVNHKHTTPDDISRAKLPHVTYLLKREKKRTGLRAKLRELKQRRS